MMATLPPPQPDAMYYPQAATVVFVRLLWLHVCVALHIIRASMTLLAELIHFRQASKLIG